MNKTNPGNFFEDFRLGQEIEHATPRTVTEGDVSLYTSLYGMRFPVNSADTFAMDMGFEAAPVDDLLVFHVVFGKTVPDISLNAVANLGYAMGEFANPVYPGDTLRAVSKVIGLKENSNGKTGVVWVHTVGLNQRDEPVLGYVRWVMVNKKDPSAPAPETVVPDLDVDAGSLELTAPESIDCTAYDFGLAGSSHTWDDYEVGERIDHVDGMTIEEAEHQIATRLYQNTAKVHFDQFVADAGRFKRRLIYGGHIISLARGLSFNGLGNAFKLVTINGGTHANQTFAGDTVYAWSEVLGSREVSGRKDVGAIRLRTVAVKNRPAADFPYKGDDGKYDPSVVLDFDYTVLMPRRG
ncbi:MAG: MaoC family dehydratase [Rhodospirillales bacterium]|nr:MaoC family dehydratase [Rhodospirillales bacterium]